MGYSYLQGFFPSPILAADGSAALPSISFASDPDTGFFKETGNRIAVSVGGATIFFIDTLSIQAPNGSTGAPAYRFGGNGLMGLYRDSGTDELVVTAGPSGGERLRLGSTVVTVNEQGTDTDFRIESDNNINHIYSDSGAFSGVGASSFGTAVGASPVSSFTIASPSITALANSDFYRTLISYSGTGVTIPAGTAPVVATLSLEEPGILGPGTVNDGYTFRIRNAPTEAVRNGAMWVESGQVRFSGLPTSAAGLPAGTLWNNSGVVNVA